MKKLAVILIVLLFSVSAFAAAPVEPKQVYSYPFKRSIRPAKFTGLEIFKAGGVLVFQSHGSKTVTGWYEPKSHLLVVDPSKGQAVFAVTGEHTPGAGWKMLKSDIKQKTGEYPKWFFYWLGGYREARALDKALNQIYESADSLTAYRQATLNGDSATARLLDAEISSAPGFQFFLSRLKDDERTAGEVTMNGIGKFFDDGNLTRFVWDQPSSIEWRPGEYVPPKESVTKDKNGKVISDPYAEEQGKKGKKGQSAGAEKKDFEISAVDTMQAPGGEEKEAERLRMIRTVLSKLSLATFTGLPLSPQEDCKDVYSAGLIKNGNKICTHENGGYLLKGNYDTAHLAITDALIRLNHIGYDKLNEKTVEDALKAAGIKDE